MAAVDRVEELRAKPKNQKKKTAETAWSWIVELQKLAKQDADKAAFELNELFRLGKPASGLNGPTDGILVMTTTNPALDTAVKLLTSVYMPWEGKAFDETAQTGENRMTASSALVSKVIWPLYKMENTADGHRAFKFKTYIEAGKDDPDREVMVIDYANVKSNPKLVIKQIRDELVEIVPGTYLGKILFKLPGDKWAMIGYFALRTN